MSDVVVVVFFFSLKWEKPRILFVLVCPQFLVKGLSPMEGRVWGGGSNRNRDIKDGKSAPLLGRTKGTGQLFIILRLCLVV